VELGQFWLNPIMSIVENFIEDIGGIADGGRDHFGAILRVFKNFLP
jgi:hypothetical protein